MLEPGQGLAGEQVVVRIIHPGTDGNDGGRYGARSMTPIRRNEPPDAADPRIGGGRYAQGCVWGLASWPARSAVLGGSGRAGALKTTKLVAWRPVMLKTELVVVKGGKCTDCTGNSMGALLPATPVSLRVGCGAAAAFAMSE